MKKFISLLLTLFLTVGLMSGCGESVLNPSGGDENSLTLWTVAPIIYNYKDILKVSPNDKQALFTKDIIEKFEADNDCTISMQNRGFGDALNEALMPALNAGSAGDIVPGEMYLNAYYKGGFYEEVKLDQEVLDDMIPQVYNRMRYDGKVYGVPIQTGVMALNINKQALRDAGAIDAQDQVTQAYADKGLNPLAPETWEDLLEICTMIRENYVSKGINDKGGMLLPKTVDGSAWRLLPVMRTAGGEILGEDGNIDMDSEENLKAFTLLRELSATVPDGSLNAQNDDALHEYFWNSKGCYIIEGTDIIARRYRYEDKFTDIYDDVIAVELPVFEGVNIKSNVLVGTLYFSITKSCKNKELALKFIEYLLSDYVQEKLVESDSRIPIRTSVLEKEMQKEDGNAQYMDAFFAPVTDDAYDFDGGLPDFERNSGNIWDDWNYFVSKLLGSNESLAALIEKAQNDMQAELDKVV